MNGAAHSLSKEERISSKKDIAALLAGGRWCSVGVLKACTAPNGLEFPRIMVSVPKRLFKRAVKRNLLKRRIREAYRLQKELLTVPCGDAGCSQDAGLAERLAGVDILFQYTSAEVADFSVIRDEVASILKKIAR